MIRALVFLACLCPSSLAAGGIDVSEDVKYYDVSGDSFAALRRQMASKGKNGFWGHTRWWITWTGGCDVDLEITIVMPRLAANNALTANQRQIWSSMVDALWRHEQMHAEHGRRAAQEIADASCDRPRRIIRKWAEQDRVLDRRTQHGKTQGVTLPN